MIGSFAVRNPCPDEANADRAGDVQQDEDRNAIPVANEIVADIFEHKRGFGNSSGHVDG
jgi:hypothetical protein